MIFKYFQPQNSVWLCLAMFLAMSCSPAVQNEASEAPASETAGEVMHEYYELRVYRIDSLEKQEVVSRYLEAALIPALNRTGIDRIGVFTLQEPGDDFSIFTLVPYPTLDHMTRLSDVLDQDTDYQTAASEYFSASIDDPAYGRIENKLMKAFDSIPVMELPAQTAGREPRIFELRTYESHHENAAYRKVQMFDEGETQIMRETGLGPVFFGEVLVGHDVPNLTYLLSSSDRETHKKSWEAFLAHPDWVRMKAMERYKDTVSKIANWFLVPTSYSQI